jgi:hypothetical protein
MIVTERDYMAQKEYYRDQMRAAQRYHLARQVQGARQEGKPFYAQALAWLRHRLARGLSRSQERYDTVGSSAVPQPR